MSTPNMFIVIQNDQNYRKKKITILEEREVQIHSKSLRNPSIDCKIDPPLKGLNWLHEEITLLVL